MKKIKIKSLKGMHDYFNFDIEIYQFLEKKLMEILNFYGFSEIRFPILENTLLFKRIGEFSDILCKEIYSFYDRNNLNISLRPEGTIGCVRSCIQNNLLFNGVLKKLWYIGPMFRYENTQNGRFRQFNQLGIEIFGSKGINVDLELILVIKRIFNKLGIYNFLSLKINTIGSILDRNRYINDLKKFIKKKKKKFFKEKKLNNINLFRIFDNKKPEIKYLLFGAPKIINYINDESLDKFNFLCKKLDNFGINYIIDTNLVRGLDYYNDFVFEFFSKKFNYSVCSGGRYDKLVNYLIDYSIPALGCAFGLERIVSLLKYYRCLDNIDKKIDVYVVSTCSEKSKILGIKIIENILDLNINIKVYNDICKYNKIKKKILLALKLNVHILIIIGKKEIENNFLTVKDLFLNKKFIVNYNNIINIVLKILK